MGAKTRIEHVDGLYSAFDFETSAKGILGNAASFCLGHLHDCSLHLCVWNILLSSHSAGRLGTRGTFTIWVSFRAAGVVGLTTWPVQTVSVLSAQG